MFMKFDVRVIDKKLSSKHEFCDIQLGDSLTLLLCMFLGQLE